MAREFEVLALLATAGVPASEPLLLDAEGHFLGVPTMVLSYVEGRSWYEPDDAESWCRQLAEAAHAVHAVTPEAYDLSRLPAYGAERTAASIERRRQQVGGKEPLALEVVEALEAALPRIEWLPPVLIHEDYWPGNTVWRRGRLVGVVDWTSAAVGDPRLDVSQCRADIVVSNGIELADAFLAAYEADGGPLPQLWFFDLMRGLLALLNYESWLRGYHDSGLRHLTSEDVGARLRIFVRRALDEAKTDSQRVG